MRMEIIKCDTCGIIHDAQYKLPFKWVTTIQTVKNDLTDEKHFCCMDCLIPWAQHLAMELDKGGVA